MVWKLLLGSLVRAALLAIGTWLKAKNLISAELQQRLVDEGTAQVVEWIIAGGLILGPILWSFVQKLRSRIELEEAHYAHPASELSDVLEAARKRFWDLVRLKG